MSITIKAWYHDLWEQHSLADYGSFSDMIAECNMRDRGDYSIGEWFYIPDEVLPPMKDVDYGGRTPNERAIYWGSWGNDNSPGASMYTYAEIFDMDDPEDAAAYEERKKEWDEAPEWIEEPGSDDEDEESDTGYEIEGAEAIELEDGGCIEPPDYDGTIRRRDKDGNCEELRTPDEVGWQEWFAMFETQDIEGKDE